ncbi:primosomal protein N' [Amylibacter sp. SFDW26]|uniref:primosomal protein N' n=1 Tax=Amylibacter sp. SFDW26 TaxID=2652722 RepID=UPI001262402A|nr:primosomal protein N' [Amylibacter sp. SFDW26]KAB7610473.1 primosomal protein N' [Amylibacter sp. SFDW26]
MTRTGEKSYFEAGTLVAVLTAEPINRFLDYKAPEGGVFVGSFVQVPLGPRKVLGVVWGAGVGGFDLSKARPVSQVLDVAPMREEMMVFLQKVADYTLTPMSAMLRLATRAPGLGDPISMRKVYALGDVEPDRITDARTRVLNVLRENKASRLTKKELADLAGVTASVVDGLVKLKAVAEVETPRDTAYPKLDPMMAGLELSESQKTGGDALRASIAEQTYSTTLLKGVTGSGKTEVYMEAVAECLAQGRQALVLLPEIALTVEFLDRVEKRFGARPAEWHSGVTMTERRRCWRMIGDGKAQLVVGARSALFLPYQNLGLIIVDEEHDTSYKQEEGVFYSARDMAVMRASIVGASVVLASATPSLETWANADAGKYKRVDLEGRFGTAELPDMEPIDLRMEEMETQSWISPALHGEVQSRLDKGEQSLLFLNRRGYAPVTVCRACGHQVGCDDCDARMVEHKYHGQLICHQCGETKPVPTKCPNCDVEGRMAAVGPGVERLAEEAEVRFPDAKIEVLSSDMALSARALKERIHSIAAGEADIIIGTQMVAKGHNFPLLTCVGVIDADLGLQGGDLRAAERTFQLIRQVAGRAGRAEKRGVAFIQTHQPDHPVIQAIMKGEEEEFWRAEAAQRREAGVPPYGRLAGIVISGPDLKAVYDVATALSRNIEGLRQIGADVFGPAPAPIARVRGNHRVRLLVKAAKTTHIQPTLERWRNSIKAPNNVRISIDIDPQSFY